MTETEGRENNSQVYHTQLWINPSDNFGDPGENGELRDEQEPVEKLPDERSDDW